MISGLFGSIDYLAGVAFVWLLAVALVLGMHGAWNKRIRS